MSGVLKWHSVEKSYGFLTGNDGVDRFVHRNNLPADVILRKGDEMEFTPAKGPWGTRAADVVKV